MYAYAMAAAHLHLRHTRVEHHQVSNPAMGDLLTWQQGNAAGYEGSREGWSYVDDVFYPNDASRASQHPCRCHTPVHSTDPRDQLPTLIHYCPTYQFRALRDQPAAAHVASFAKWSMPSTILDCSSPLLEEPWALTPLTGDTIGYSTAATRHAPDLDAPAGLRTRKKRHRRAFLMCQTTLMVNRALEDHKRAFCPNGFNTNRTLRVLKD